MAKRRTRKRKSSTKRKIFSLRKFDARSWRHWKRWLAVLSVLCLAYVVYLDVSIRIKFEGKRWEIPAHVYARPLELYQGKKLTGRQLELELDQLGYRVAYQPDDPGTYTSSANKFIFKTRAFEFWDGKEPSRLVKVELDRGAVARLTDGETGQELSLARLDPMFIGGIYPDKHEDRLLIQLKNTPALLTDGLIAVEDRCFIPTMASTPGQLHVRCWQILRRAQRYRAAAL